MNNVIFTNISLKLNDSACIKNNAVSISELCTILLKTK